jgi:conjugative relaxase-like TrwC/TraI family protein
VITIKAQSSPRNAARYFDEHLSHDDYYSDKEQTIGRWFGQTCEMLGVERESPVEQKQFVALCNGLRPDDQAKLTQRQVANRRCLYDLTVSAPKSVSIMALLGGDTRLIAAHEKAVAAALEVAEKLACIRVRKGAAVDTRQNRVTGNIIAARFLHRESRALDPQLHTHCVIFNVSHDPVEQRMKAIEARQFYDQSKLLTQTYRDHFSKSLRELGYETYLDKQRCPQIRGIDENIIAKFSKRSRQRDNLVALKEKELGRSLSNNEVAAVVHRNRAKKERHIDPESVREFQQDQLSPEVRLQLQGLKERAFAAPRQPLIPPSIPVIPPPLIPPPTPVILPPNPVPNWIAVVRLALLAGRAADIDPHMFSPDLSFPQRVCQAGKFLRHVQRTQAYLRYSQRTMNKQLSR